MTTRTTQATEAKGTETAPEPKSRFVVAESKSLDGRRAVVARSALADWDDWEYVEDAPLGPATQLPMPPTPGTPADQVEPVNGPQSTTEKEKA